MAPARQLEAYADADADSDRLRIAGAQLLFVRGLVCKALREGDLQAANAYLKAETVAAAELRAALRSAKEES